MRKLPKKLKVLGADWAVEVHPVDPDDAQCFGSTAQFSRTIELYTIPHEMQPQRGPIQQTLFHEAMHAALTTAGLGSVLGKSEEAVVTCIEEALWPLIQSGIFNVRGK